MNEDDITSITLGLHDAFINLGIPLDEEEDWERLHDFMQDFLSKFVNKERNYN